MSDFTFKMTVATNVGLVRTNNEDNFIVNPDLTQGEWFIPSDTDAVIPLGKNGAVMVVADGMGGMNAGEVASELAVSSIRHSFESVEDFSKVVDCSNHIESFLKRAIVDADSIIKHRVKEDPSTSGMGTTIVVAWVIDNVAHVAWCGDSRAYLFNHQYGLSRLSRDHSYVQELVDSGKLDAELAFDHPNSNIITRSLGDSAVKAQPDYVCKRLSAGDFIILCSDGLCGLVRDEEILELMMKDYDSIEDYKKELFNAALEAGGYDNITIGVFQCVSVKESELTDTVAPGASSRKSKAGKSFGKGTHHENEQGSYPEQRSGKKWLWIVVILLVLAALCFAAFHFGLVSLDEARHIQFNLNK